MKVTRTLASTALTVGLVAGGTALVSAPAQAAPEAGSHNQVRNQQSQNQQGQTQQTEDEAR
ncbi:MAG: cell wall-associated hydrolase, partial [Brevibacterium aurantiacum]